MQSLKVFLCLLIFISIVPAQQETFVPISTVYYLLGGAQNGKWLTTEQIAPKMEKKTRMVLVDLKGIGKTGAFLEDKGDEYGACPENKVMQLAPEIETGIAVGANAKWNLVPRIPKSIAATDKTYQKIAADFLKTKRITRTKIKLSQILQVDLEGDGQTEIIIAGNFYKKGMTEIQTAGDYSFVLLRKIVGGKAQNILVEGEFFTNSDGDYSPPNERQITAVADLNGDGRMEIVLHSFYYEGSWEQVFEIKGTKLLKVLEVSCIV